jgi:hypothetical protein
VLEVLQKNIVGVDVSSCPAMTSNMAPLNMDVAVPVSDSNTRLHITQH